MGSLRRPTANQIEKFLGEQANQAYSYTGVGGTREGVPEGYNIDCHRVLLGQGANVYHVACTALQNWRMFPTGWTKVVASDANPQAGTVVALLARGYGLWWLNACRVVYCFDDAATTARRFGFAYGTLPGHVEMGEERFMVEWDHEDHVWFDIFAFSRPRHPLVKFAHPLARRLQKRFAQDALAQMRLIVDVEKTSGDFVTGSADVPSAQDATKEVALQSVEEEVAVTSFR